MTFDNNVPEWKNEGSDPPDTLKEEGFTAGYKPPAAYFNWFFNRIQKSVKEIQEKLSNDLKAMAFKEDIGGEDISETVIETLDTVEDKYPVPAAGESVKRFFGKILRFLKNIKPLISNVSLYVSTTGSDETGDGSQENPFRTIQFALDYLPKDLGGHTATINVAEGTYNESLYIIDFNSGLIEVIGINGDATQVKINKVTCTYNTAFVAISFLELLTTDDYGISASDCAHVLANTVKCIGVTSTFYGMYFSEVNLFRVYECEISNKARGVHANNANGYVRATGVNNQYSVAVSGSSRVNKVYNNMEGDELSTSGGMLTGNGGTQISGLITSGLSCTWGTIQGGYVRHGNLNGVAMVTLEFRVILTSNISSTNNYLIAGFPTATGIGSANIAVTCSVPISSCYLDIGDGGVRFQPAGNMAAGQSFVFNATYLTNS